MNISSLARRAGISPSGVRWYEASGMMLPLWEDVLPNVSDEELAEAARRIAAAL